MKKNNNPPAGGRGVAGEREEIQIAMPPPVNFTTTAKPLLGISVNVKLVEKKTLERREGKAERVVDLRKF